MLICQKYSRFQNNLDNGNLNTLLGREEAAKRPGEKNLGMDITKKEIRGLYSENLDHFFLMRLNTNQAQMYWSFMRDPMILQQLTIQHCDFRTKFSVVCIAIR